MKLQTMGDEHEKQELINEAKTLRFSLTRNDRKFLRAYLGYEKVVQNIPNRVLKKKSEACYFVQRALWAKGKKKSIQKSNNSKENEKEEDKEGEEGEEEEEEEEEEIQTGRAGKPFDLQEMMTNNIPRIFDHSIDELRNLLSEASAWKDYQQVAFIR